MGVILGVIIENKLALFSVYSLFGFLTALFIEAGTFALNDYCDIKSDIANKRKDRPLVGGDIMRGEALVISVVSITAGIIFASFLNPLCFSLAIILCALGIAYDINIKKFFLSNNFYIAFTMAIPFIFGGLIVSKKINYVLFVLFSIAFLTGFGREVMKDIMDMKGDTLRNVNSIAQIYGKEEARNVAILFFSLAAVLSLIPFFVANFPYFLNYAYIIPILATDALLMHTIFGLRKDFDMKYMRKETLITIVIGLLAFFCGALCA